MEGGHERARNCGRPGVHYSLLIELYKGHPELWKVKSKNYFNRIKKNAALIQIKNALKKIKTDITVEEIKKKINSLRACLLRLIGTD